MLGLKPHIFPVGNACGRHFPQGMANFYSREDRRQFRIGDIDMAEVNRSVDIVANLSGEPDTGVDEWRPDQRGAVRHLL